MGIFSLSATMKIQGIFAIALVLIFFTGTFGAPTNPEFQVQDRFFRSPMALWKHQCLNRLLRLNSQNKKTACDLVKRYAITHGRESRGCTYLFNYRLTGYGTKLVCAT